MNHAVLIGILGLVAIATCWSLAVVLFRLSASGSVARRLAVLLVVEGFVLVTAQFPEFAFAIPYSFFDSHPKFDWFLGLAHHSCDVAMLSLYPPFLAQALDTKLTRPFGNKRVRIGLVVVSLLLVLDPIVSQSRIGITFLYSAVTLLFVFAFLASVNAWYIAERGIARERAGIFALAFGLRDIGWSLSYGIFAWLKWTQPDSAYMPDIAWFAKTVYALGTLLAVPLIAYGILRTQLFDIDLRIRWTIKQSTFAAAVVVITFIVSEGVEQLVSAELGNMWGLVAAAVAVLFVKPLQKFAERVVSVVMPNTQDTPEYRTTRKMLVYEAAFAEASHEDDISPKERALLNRLRDSLGLSESQAQAIEADVLMRNVAVA